MKSFIYTNWYLEMKFVSPHSKFLNSFKIDTGSEMTALPREDFKHFFPPKSDIYNGEEMMLFSASGSAIIGYSHKVLVNIADLNKNIILDICFYNAKRRLLGMDMIKKYFKICLEKNNYLIGLN